MGLNWQKNEGWSNVNAYLLPGIPYLFTGLATDPAQRVAFPLVTKYIDVKNTSPSGSIRVGFSQHGVESGSQYVMLGLSGSQRFDVRVTEMWVMSDQAAETVDFDISVGLSAAQNPSPLTGSLGSPFKGIG